MIKTLISSLNKKFNNHLRNLPKWLPSISLHKMIVKTFMSKVFPQE